VTAAGGCGTTNREASPSSPLARQTGVVAADQREMISTDLRMMHRQAVIAGTRLLASVILDCLAAGMTANEITAEYPRLPSRAYARPPPTAPHERARICVRCRSRDDVRARREPARVEVRGLR
jgi:uncharacterized protein (DUF433 family)